MCGELCSYLENIEVGSAHIRFGSKADMCSAQAPVRYGPEADINK